jgi:hypothetical protein
MIRSIAAVLAALVAAVVVITVVQSIGHFIYPPPPDIDAATPDGMAAIIAQAPVPALLFVVLAYICGAVTGGAVVAKVGAGPPMTRALVVGAVLTFAGLLNVLTLPHPIWLAVLAVGVHLPSAWLGARLASSAPGR